MIMISFPVFTCLGYMLWPLAPKNTAASQLFKILVGTVESKQKGLKRRKDAPAAGVFSALAL